MKRHQETSSAGPSGLDDHTVPPVDVERGQGLDFEQESVIRGCGYGFG